MSKLVDITGAIVTWNENVDFSTLFTDDNANVSSYYVGTDDIVFTSNNRWLEIH